MFHNLKLYSLGREGRNIKLEGEGGEVGGLVFVDGKEEGISMSELRTPRILGQQKYDFHYLVYADCILKYERKNIHCPPSM